MKKPKIAPRNTKLYLSDTPINRRVMLCVPMTGLVRAEWMLARYGQMIPTNWSHGELIQWMDMHVPMGFGVAEARNLAVKHFIDGGWEWLFFIDHDVILPMDTFSKFNWRMHKRDVPIWGGLYFTKSQPAEPLMYREWGESFITDWKLGDEVWVRGMGMGCNVIHRSILELLYKDSEEYEWGGHKMRKVFETPRTAGINPETGMWTTSGGTEDIYFYDRIIKGGYLKKAGWPKVAGKKYPYLCDTSVFARHIDVNGKQYPANGEEKAYVGK
jgi:hypothetical protein